MLSHGQLESFRERGYLHLGPLISRPALGDLQERMDDLTSGRIVHEKLSFQSEPSAPGEPGAYGFAGPSDRYRKIGGLHHDPLMWAFITLPAAVSIMHQLIGTALAGHRAMVLLKPAAGGSELSWHRDCGQGFPVEPVRYYTIWTTLDAATVENGAMYVIPGTHAAGAITGSWDEVTQRSRLQAETAQERSVLLPAAAGESYLLDPRVLHASGVNDSPHRRRAMNVIYMPAGAPIEGEGSGDHPAIPAPSVA